MSRPCPDKYLFKLKLSTKDLIWHILFGLIFFCIAFDIQFTHYVFEQESWSFENICGILTGFVIGPLLVITEIFNYFRPTNFLKIYNDSLTIFGCLPSGKIQTLPWSEIETITIGELPDGSFKHKEALKIILRPNAKLKKDKKTNPIFLWQSGIVWVCSKFISEDLNKVINVLNYIKGNPQQISAKNQDFRAVATEMKDLDVNISDKVDDSHISEKRSSRFKNAFVNHTIASSLFVPSLFILLIFVGIYDDMQANRDFIASASRLMTALMGSLSAIPFNSCFKGYRLLFFSPFLIVFAVIGLFMNHYIEAMSFFDIVAGFIFGQSIFWLTTLAMTIFSVYIDKDSED